MLSLTCVNACMHEFIAGLFRLFAFLCFPSPFLRIITIILHLFPPSLFNSSEVGCYEFVHVWVCERDMCIDSFVHCPSHIGLHNQFVTHIPYFFKSDHTYLTLNYLGSFAASRYEWRFLISLFFLSL